MHPMSGAPRCPAETLESHSPVVAPVASDVGVAVPTPLGVRLDYIDALRGLAALLVVWLHVTEVFAQVAPRGAWLYRIAADVDAGRIGVVLFFAISGFVIPSSLRLRASVGPVQATRRFLIHRFFRLFPAYWASVFAAAVLGITLTTPLARGTVLANLTMVQAMFGVPDAIGLYWSLRVELVFYALCVVLFLSGVLHRPTWLAGAVVTALAAFFGGYLLRHWIAPETWPERLVQFPLYALFLAMMFWGALFRRWQRQDGEGLDALSRAVLVGFPLFICALPLLVLVANYWRPVRLGSSFSHALGIGLFVVLTLVIRVRGQIGAWLGRISYSLYLFHPIVLYALFAAMQSGHLAWLSHANLAVPLTLCMALSIALAAAMHYSIELPAIGLGRCVAGD